MVLRDRLHDLTNYVLYPEKIKDIQFQPIFFQLRKILSKQDYGIDKDLLNKFLSDDLLESYKALCKNQEYKEQIPSEAYIDAAKMFVDDLKRIINNSPPINEETIVYRGSKTLYYSTTNLETFKNNTFMSTSYSISSPVNFINERFKCCIKKIILKPGAKALFMDCITQYDQENEILLPPDTEFKIVSHEIKTYYNLPSIKEVSEDTIIQNFCKSKKDYMTVTTMQQI